MERMSIYIKVINRILLEFFFGRELRIVEGEMSSSNESSAISFDGKSASTGYPSSHGDDDDDAPRVSRNFVRFDVPRRCRI